MVLCCAVLYCSQQTPGRSFCLPAREWRAGLAGIETSVPLSPSQPRLASPALPSSSPGRVRSPKKKPTTPSQSSAGQAGKQRVTSALLYSPRLKYTSFSQQVESYPNVTLVTKITRLPNEENSKFRRIV